MTFVQQHTSMASNGTSIEQSYDLYSLTQDLLITKSLNNANLFTQGEPRVRNCTQWQ